MGSAVGADGALPPEGDYEHDAEVEQEAEPLQLCLQPAEAYGPEMPPPDSARFSVAFSRPLFAGWATQTSPACAAGAYRSAKV